MTSCIECECSVYARRVRAVFYVIDRFSNSGIHIGKLDNLLLFLWALKYIYHSGFNQDLRRATVVYSDNCKYQYPVKFEQ